MVCPQQTPRASVATGGCGSRKSPLYDRFFNVTDALQEANRLGTPA